MLVAALAVTAVVGCTEDAAWDAGAAATTTTLDVLPGDSTMTITRADVDAAVAGFPAVAEEAMAESGVPGMAIGVVYDDEVVWTAGFGLREVGTDDAVEPTTVFQLASVSKPVGSTVVAALVGRGDLDWDDPVAEHLPGFDLADPWVGDHVTVADMYSHRSGLPDHAGDLLEELGFEQQEIFDRLRMEPLEEFRSGYAYTNYGLTAGAVAAANAAGGTWDDLSDEVLYEPLGMDHTSSRFDDFMAEPDRAIPHVRDERGEWVVGLQRQPDAQTPAGGVSSNVEDMAQWLRLQLGNGTVDGVELVDAEALAATHAPHGLSGHASSPTARIGSYGLGWNILTDDAGRQRWGHSGAFALGAATTVSIVPAERLGVVVLTNGLPIGFAEAMTESFVDLALEGQVTRDWFGLVGPIFASMLEPETDVDWSTPPPSPTPAAPDAAYVADFTSDYYGPLSIVAAADGLEVVIGPGQRRSPLRHYDGDTFTFVPGGESGQSPSGLVVERGPDGAPATVTATYLDESGLGSFRRT